MNYVEEEITLAEFADRFLQLSDFTTPSITDMTDMGIEVLGYNKEAGIDTYNKINSFLVKPSVTEHYTDGALKGTNKHRVIENNIDIHLENHPDFHQVNEPMNVVDISVDDTENYYANGRLNHNTTSGGKAIAFHSSVRIRFSSVGQIKDGDKQTIGIKTEAKIVKNRIGPPQRTCAFEIYFSSGIDNYASWLTKLKEKEIIKQGGAWYSFDFNGEEFKFQSKEFGTILNDRPEIKEYLYGELVKIMVMEYKHAENPRCDDEDVDVVDEAIAEN